MRIRTVRTKRENLWITLYLEKISPDVFHLGANINKSKRAQNDWYRVRKNKRARRAARTSNIRHHKYLITLKKLLEKTIAQLPEGVYITIMPASSKTISIHKYVERLGFTLVQMDALQVWVLEAPQS